MANVHFIDDVISVHIFSLTRAKPSPAPSVITIGNFDGLHLGHQQLINQVKAQAQTCSAVSTVMIFEPQPLEHFCPTCAPARLMPLSNKLCQLKQLGVEQVAVVNFNESIASLPARDFVQTLLVERLNAQAVWVGDDFRFGIGRSGDFSLMQAFGAEFGFSVTQTPSFTHLNKRVSSTWIRETLASGDMTLTQSLLGRHYHLYGRVMHGQKLGRQMGFPTMNINLKHPLAVSGVFAVSVEGLAELPLHGVANLGVRPSVSGNNQQRLEVHLFDWQGDAYGRKINVVFHHRLRSEQRFESLLALTQQIEQDASLARQWWRDHSV